MAAVDNNLRSHTGSVLNDKAVEKNGQMVLQSDGTVLDAEQVVRVVGLVAKNGFLEIPGALNERGFVDTYPYNKESQ